MLLKNISGNTNLKGKFFYFAADNLYFNEYGKALISSLKKYAPWANIHCHLYNPKKLDLFWCNVNRVTTTYEKIDANRKEFKALCACIRFVRIPEIFNNRSKIISLDCDMIAIKNIPECDFDKDTDVSRTVIRKSGYPIASSVSFGNDRARKIFSNRLRKEIENDNIYWYLDQHILETMVKEQIFQTMENKWSNYNLNEEGFMWAAKGDRKFSKAYIKETSKFKKNSP